jgi:hypothetical protein
LGDRQATGEELRGHEVSERVERVGELQPLGQPLKSMSGPVGMPRMIPLGSSAGGEDEGESRRSTQQSLTDANDMDVIRVRGTWGHFEARIWPQLAPGR